MRKMIRRVSSSEAMTRFSGDGKGMTFAGLFMPTTYVDASGEKRLL
jgi:hypothetical protein